MQPWKLIKRVTISPLLGRAEDWSDSVVAETEID